MMIMKRFADSFATKKLMVFSTYTGLLLLSYPLYAIDQIKPSLSMQAAATPESPLHQHDSVEPQLPVPTASQTQNQSQKESSVPEQNEAESSASSNTGTVPIAEKNDIIIVNRPQVTGLWAMTIPGAHCTEYYNFMENGDVAIKSGEEWTYGNYVYQLPAVAEPGLPVLAMRIKYDNLKTDCSGNALDQRGEEQQQYIKWDNSSNINFCAAQDGKQCFASLRKILP